ncbi:Lipase, class 2 [Cordyceps javanica]|uniref:Lipase, class 2 n=1 Tax=Cordyceps javanica TaxID=43265 RepID=A0A545VR53_9HYPO|nr:Lipase, class 2 [Cordyceps javanica]TQW04221.1 Lipase, class 2 [Cordyceps javanica]
MHFKVVAALAGLASLASASPAAPASVQTLETRQAKHNDFSCKPSAGHPNPVVLLHGLGATYYEDINLLEFYLQSKGFCTFSLTYGAYEGFPFVGGLKPIDESSHEIADLIREVHARTGAAKIDIVGHSEGGFQSLYVPKFREGISALVENVVAIAPPTHGTTFANLWKLAPLFGQNAREDIGAVLEKVGCAPCDEISVGGPAIAKLNDGTPVAQPGNTVTVIISKYDELVTPPTTAFIGEDGVNNIYVQDYCPLDPVGHIGEAYDTNVWNLVVNSLEKQVGRKFLCLLGSPGK